MEENKDDINASVLANPFLLLQKIDGYKNNQQKLKQESNKICAALNEIILGLSNNDFNNYVICNLKDMLEQHINVFEVLELRDIVEDTISKCAAKMSEDLDDYDGIAELNKIEAEEETISWNEIQSKNDLLD